MMPSSGSWRWSLLAACALCLPSCTPVALSIAPTPESELEHALFLIGDAGEPVPGGDPVLLALRAALDSLGTRATVVFLGDNIYPRGLPPEGDPLRADAERRLLAQLDAVRGTGARSIFLPGNHDWVYQRGGDPEAVQRQQRFALAHGDERTHWLPPDACPGPATLDIEGLFRIVVIDTEWWIAGRFGRAPAQTACAHRTARGVLDALGREIEGDDDLPVVIATHHPLATGGVHGGYFPFSQHVFPLRALHPALWIPLPVIGSLYPIVRGGGFSNQDLSGPRYRLMRAALDSTLRAHPPLVYAAGHDHNLQVLEGGATHGAWRLVVSGSGSFGHTERVGTLPNTRYATDDSGWVRLDFHAAGERAVSVVTVTRDAVATTVFREIGQPDR